MKKVLALAALSILLHGCGGGGGGSDDGSSSTNGTVTFAIADAPIDDTDSVVITIDKVILRRDGASDVVVDRFTIPSLDLTDAETFQIDLLDYRNGNRLLIIDDLVVPAGKYSQLILQVLDDDVNYSYVDILGSRVPIKQPSEQLKLGGFTINSNGVYGYTLDFDLRKAMTRNSAGNRIILKPRGVRIVDEQTVSTLQGRVDPMILNLDPGCLDKGDPLRGNAVYLYQNHNINGPLVDVYDPEIETRAPAGAANPYATAVVYQENNGSWNYHFGYLPAGDYTLAFACRAHGDQAETLNAVNIPEPGTQRAELTLTALKASRCNLPIVDGQCEFSD